MPEACKTPRKDSGHHPHGCKPGGSLFGRNHKNRSPPAMCYDVFILLFWFDVILLGQWQHVFVDAVL